MLTTRFETVMIDEYESFSKLYVKLMGIINSNRNLSKLISNSKVMRKIFRSREFKAKVIDIEKFKCVNFLKITKLVCYLQTIEMILGLPRRAKGIALKYLLKKQS